LTGAKAYVALTVLALLGLAALPIFPTTETASVRLQTVEASLAEPLPDENPYEIPDLAGSASRGAGTDGTPGADALMLSVRRLGLKDVRVPMSSSQAVLDRAGIIRLESSGAPSEPGSNTFIVGHAIGYPGGLYPYVFYELDRLRPGDEVSLRDSSGRGYTYRVYDRMIVRPQDYWVTYPVPGKTIVSLQGSYPVPTFERRLIVRAELVGSSSPDGRQPSSVAPRSRGTG
jgi:sortase A